MNKVWGCCGLLVTERVVAVLWAAVVLCTCSIRYRNPDRPYNFIPVAHIQIRCVIELSKNVILWIELYFVIRRVARYEELHFRDAWYMQLNSPY